MKWHTPGIDAMALIVPIRSDPIRSTQSIQYEKNENGLRKSNLVKAQGLLL